MSSTEQPPGKYLPAPDGLNAEFYQRASGGTLHLQRCAACGQLRHPPRYYCAACQSPDYDWAPSGARGSLFSWTVTHRPTDPGWAADVPFTTAVVELDEGVRLVGALEGVDPGALELDAPMVAHVEPRTDDFAFISFLPATGPPGQ